MAKLIGRRVEARAVTHGRSARPNTASSPGQLCGRKVTGGELWAKLSRDAKADLELDAGLRDAVESADFE